MIDTFKAEGRAEYIVPRFSDFAQNVSYLSRCFFDARRTAVGDRSNTSSRSAANALPRRKLHNRSAQTAPPRD
jgi:hypothetical protein